MPKTAAEIIIEHGDYRAVALKLGESHWTVASWKSRNAIPRYKWPEVLDAFPDLTLNDLRATEQLK